MTLFKLLLVSSVLLLAACGIKPKELTPPSAGTAQETVFPKQYPDPGLTKTKL